MYENRTLPYEVELEMTSAKIILDGCLDLNVNTTYTCMQERANTTQGLSFAAPNGLHTWNFVDKSLIITDIQDTMQTR